MLRIITALMLSAVAIPATAKPPVTELITKTGDHYRYTSELQGNRVAIRGELVDTGEAIDLILDARGRVDGTVGYNRVSFAVPRQQRDTIVAYLTKAATPADMQVAGIR